MQDEDRTAKILRYLKSFEKKEKPFFSYSKDWKTMLFIFFAINVVILAWSVYVFNRTKSNEVYNINYGQEQEFVLTKIDEFLLAKTLAIFESKLENFEKLKNSDFKYIDPSI